MSKKPDLRAICEAARAEVAKRTTVEPVREFAPDRASEAVEEFATVEDAMAWLRGEPKPSA